ncbi:MAG: thioredoxin family protein [Candidatus Krumholzibacteriia bacterium]
MSGARPGARDDGATGSGGPGWRLRLAVIAGLVAAVVVVFAIRAGDGGEDRLPPPVATQATEQDGPASAIADDQAQAEVPLPRLVDLGADKCIPCKAMAPILAELEEEYAGRFDVVFIDVWKNREKAQEYGIRMIPTQIFMDASGNELFRHEGFFSREDILGTWRRHGYDFGAEPTPPSS